MASDDGTCRCGARWAGKAAAHCSACHQTFSGATMFDRHRSNVGERGKCLAPGRLVNTKTGERVMYLIDGVWRAEPN